MITFMETKQPSSSPPNSLDPQLWHACAGNTVHLPVVNSKVFYFPQGHAEHASGNVDFRSCPKVPAAIPCCVSAVHFLADSETDEVYAKMTLLPIVITEFDFSDSGDVAGANAGDQEKMATFAKTLTQSDANNGGGFSVPRYCAEMIFPKLDYTADPPVQTISARDVHGEVWRFRHIYRGTPRRHLLTTGWSNFVNSKKLVAGDSIVFMRAENSDICIGIRRAKRTFGIGPEITAGWNPGGFPALLQEVDENRLSSRHDDRNDSNWGRGSRGKVKASDVVEAMTLAARRQPFDVEYYPRASTPEFCVRAALVRSAMQIRWCSRMRFKMAFETEDCSRVSWFVGTIAAAQVADPIQWPDSPWRLLQVTWDEPELLQNVKRVNPWLVEIVTNMPTVHLGGPFAHPHKKMRLASLHSDFQGEDVPIPLPAFANSPFGCLQKNTPAGMQGARHAQYSGLPIPDIHRMQTTSLLPVGFFPPNRASAASGMTNLMVPSEDESVCCSLTIGNSSHHRSAKSDNTAKAAPFLLFGQPMVPESHTSPSHSNGNVLDQSVASLSKPRSGTSPCKIFVESEDVGRTLDLSLLDSYKELYSKVEDMFGIDISDTQNRVVYHDAAGLERQLGDTLFSDFVQTARRLTIQINHKSSSSGL